MIRWLWWWWRLWGCNCFVGRHMIDSSFVVPGWYIFVVDAIGIQQRATVPLASSVVRVGPTATTRIWGTIFSTPVFVPDTNLCHSFLDFKKMAMNGVTAEKIYLLMFVSFYVCTPTEIWMDQLPSSKRQQRKISTNHIIPQNHIFIYHLIERHHFSNNNHDDEE